MALLAPKGRPLIARGGAQRNPWKVSERQLSPGGAAESAAPPGLGQLREIGFQGLRCAPPLAINGRRFAADAAGPVAHTDRLSQYGPRPVSSTLPLGGSENTVAWSIRS